MTVSLGVVKGKIRLFWSFLIGVLVIMLGWMLFQGLRLLILTFGAVITALSWSISKVQSRELNVAKRKEGVDSILSKLRVKTQSVGILLILLGWAMVQVGP